MKKRLALYLAAFLVSFFGKLNAQITIPIVTKNVALILQTDKSNHLKIIYAGKSLKNVDEYNNASAVNNLNAEGAASNTMAYTVAGINNNYVEPAIAVVHADGNNSLDLIYQSHKTVQSSDGASLTTVTLKDAFIHFL